MQFLHKRLYLDSNDTVVVSLDTQANVMLTDDSNFSSYRSGRGGYRYYGGLATASPVRLSPPHSGYWNVTIDLAGRGGSIRHSINVIKG